LAVVLFACLRASAAAAQGCHVSDPHPSEALRVRLSTLASFATYENPVYAGEYQGYTGAAGVEHRWFSAEASLTGYRIVRNGKRDHGPGDLMLMLRGTAFHFDEVAALGVGLGATFPTGDENKGLGMGHVMLMPGVWFALRHGGLRLALDVAYGRAIGDEHMHSTPGGPLVNPMNASEIEHAVAASYVFWRGLFLSGRVYGAVPIADANGLAREALSFGLGGMVWRFELGIEQHLPLAGTPFEAKTVLRVAAVL
jgi:hypothetical protein